MRKFFTSASIIILMFSKMCFAQTSSNNQPPTVNSVSISGNLNVGDTLHVRYNYSDSDGDPEGATTFTWLHGYDTVYAVFSDPSVDRNYYVLDDDHLGNYVAVVVTPAALTGTTFGIGDTSSFIGPVGNRKSLYPDVYNISPGRIFSDWQSSSAAETYPTRLTFQQFSREPSSPNAEPSGLYRCAYNQATNSRIVGQGESGISFINTDAPTEDCTNGSNPVGYVGAAVLAFSTYDPFFDPDEFYTGPVIHFRTSLKTNGDGSPPREYRIRPQYKVAGDAHWSNAWASEEFSSVGAKVDSVVHHRIVTTGELDNKEWFYIRWIYYQIEKGATGSRPEISLDDIVVEFPYYQNRPPSVLATATGAAVVDSILTGSYSYLDLEDDLEGASRLNWYRKGDGNIVWIQIHNSSSNHYKVQPIDVGHYLFFGVNPEALTGSWNPAALYGSNYIGPIVDNGVITGTHESMEESTIYPNPTNGTITISGYDVDNPIVSIGIYSSTGDELISAPVTFSQTIISLAELKSGFYLGVLYHCDGRKEIKKIVRD